MKAIVFIIPQIFFVARAVLKSGDYLVKWRVKTNRMRAKTFLMGYDGR